ncbi:hypothetical protein JX265_004889 [Neoarthrinium moseri]|uniref:Uncharacterized protein n=1 Tax=Neoarthrinium moseri TaxID=1658444 RepID=A0A9P9WQ78_9PEZI|nr:hypothetical protein JX266_007141 [Neoarthrinium moseri]KAI1874681.1 hypothetical protein JX265_004889 [Neoarthrinium moseri]
MPQASHLRSAPRRQLLTSIPNGVQLAGYIAWLPRRDCTNANLGLDEGCYNHPVVIISPLVQGDEVGIFLITSLDDNDLATKYRSKNTRLNYLPIAPSNFHPDNGKLLYLEDQAKLRKKSYVNTGRQYRVPLSSLHPYCNTGRVFVLDKHSYQELICYAGLNVPELDSRVSSSQPIGSSVPLGCSESSLHPGENLLPTEEHPDVPCVVSIAPPQMNNNAMEYASTVPSHPSNRSPNDSVDGHACSSVTSVQAERQRLLSGSENRPRANLYGTNARRFRRHGPAEEPWLDKCMAEDCGGLVPICGSLYLLVWMCGYVLAAYAVVYAFLWAMWAVGAGIAWAWHGFQSLGPLVINGLRDVVVALHHVFDTVVNWAKALFLPDGTH